MKAFIVLEDGTVFEGNSFGAKGEVVGEIVFNTGMTGYQEVLTDPSYCGQIVTMTYPLIGNYGVNDFDGESKKPQPKGFIVREACDFPSNFRCSMTISDYLEKNNIIGIYGVDTRALTRILREKGTMNGVLSTNDSIDANKLSQMAKSYKIINPVNEVSVKEKQVFKAEGEEKYSVSLIDLGLKQNIVRSLQKRGCTVTVYPCNTPAGEIINSKPNGIMLSNGPGDPKDCKEIIENIKTLMKINIPMFGICLGHQLTALANGGDTSKLKYGHRGGNHPVKDIKKGVTYITSQNHGYAVLKESIDEAIGEVSHINMNDETCEGVIYKNAPVFTVQFHPEASPGPQDTAYLFDEFIKVMENNKK